MQKLHTIIYIKDKKKKFLFFPFCVKCNEIWFFLTHYFLSKKNQMTYKYILVCILDTFKNKSPSSHIVSLLPLTLSVCLITHNSLYFLVKLNIFHPS